MAPVKVVCDVEPTTQTVRSFTFRLRKALRGDTAVSTPGFDQALNRYFSWTDDWQPYDLATLVITLAAKARSSARDLEIFACLNGLDGASPSRPSVAKRFGITKEQATNISRNVMTTVVASLLTQQPLVSMRRTSDIGPYRAIALLRDQLEHQELDKKTTALRNGLDMCQSELQKERGIPRDCRWTPNLPRYEESRRRAEASNLIESVRRRRLGTELRPLVPELSVLSPVEPQWDEVLTHSDPSPEALAATHRAAQQHADPTVRKVLNGLVRRAVHGTSHILNRDFVVDVEMDFVIYCRESEDVRGVWAADHIEAIAGIDHPRSLQAAIQASIILSASQRFTHAFKLLRRYGEVWEKACKDDPLVGQRLALAEAAVHSRHALQPGPHRRDAVACANDAAYRSANVLRKMRADPPVSGRANLYTSLRLAENLWARDLIEDGASQRRITLWQGKALDKLSEIEAYFEKDGLDSVLRLQIELVYLGVSLQTGSQNDFRDHMIPAASAWAENASVPNIGWKLARLLAIARATGWDVLEAIAAPLPSTGWSPDFQPSNDSPPTRMREWQAWRVNPGQPLIAP